MKELPVAFDFAKLTEEQLRVLGLIAMNMDGGHNPETIRLLLRLDMIEEYEERLSGRLPVIVKRHLMPIRVHIEWCEWCSKNAGQEA